MSKRGSMNAIRFASKPWDNQRKFKRKSKKVSKHQAIKALKKEINKKEILLQQYSKICERVDAQEIQLQTSVDKYMLWYLKMDDIERRRIRKNLTAYIQYVKRYKLLCTLDEYFENIVFYEELFNLYDITRKVRAR